MYCETGGERPGHDLLNTCLHSLNQSAAAVGIMCPIDAAIFSPMCHNWESQSLLPLHFYLTSVLPRQLPSPSCFDSVLCDAGNQSDPENSRMRDWNKEKGRRKKKRQLTFKARRQRGKVLDRIKFVNPLGRDFLRLHGLHLAKASLSPLICHVIGHWALSDHVLETSCLVTTDWDLLYHWHRRLSLSRLLLHHLRVELVCVAFCLWGGELASVSCLGTLMKHWTPACLTA